MSSPLFLTPVAGAGLAGVDGLRAVATVDGLRWAVSTFGEKEDGGFETVLAARPWPETGEPAQRIALPQMLPGQTSWDLAWVGDGVFEIVYEVAGGATNDLSLKPWERGRESDAREPAPPRPAGAPLQEVELVEESGTDLLVNAGRMEQGYNQPRFADPVLAGGRCAVSAVADDRRLALFEPDGDSAYRYRETGVSCDLAVVLRPAGGGWLAVCQRHVSGLPRPGTHARPGKLTLHLWDAGLVPVAPAVELFGGAPVYDFDAALCDAGVAVLATAQSGALLALGPATPTEAPWRIVPVEVPGTAGPLSLPALVATGDGLQLLLVEDAGTPRARLVAGRQGL